MDLNTLWVYDIETYKELFSFSIVRADGKFKKTFECSIFKNEIEGIFKCLDYLHNQKHYLVGFNSNQFDWPIVQELVNKRDKLPKSGASIASMVFRLAQKQINSFKDGGFGNIIKPADQYIHQVDLFKIHHFDNKAKQTSLKIIEFNLKLDTIEDLPYDIHSKLTPEMIDKIKYYNEHDVEATRLFLHQSLEQVSFRFQLTDKYSKDFLNHNDSKIGGDYFQMKLEELGFTLTRHVDGKKVLKQSPRDNIKLKDCIFGYYKFIRPETQAVYDWLMNQTITETKGVFSDIEEYDLGDLAKYSELVVKRKRFKGKPSDAEIAEFMKEHKLGWISEEELKATEWLFNSSGEHVMYQPVDEDGNPKGKIKKTRVAKKSYWGCWNVAETLNTCIDGYRIDFGTGGIHASLNEKVVRETCKYVVRDADVSSMYPNIAISNRVYPEHLGDKFCDIYQDIYEQRKSYPKGSAENAMLKLALNATYGNSNNQYSVFYDPKFTMMITINGQLALLMLADQLLTIPNLKLVQLNTDGLTVAMTRDSVDQYSKICKAWEQTVKLELEYVDYSKMYIKNVNNYIAVYTNGKVKRKGLFQYEGLGHHQNQGGLIIAEAVEQSMVNNVDIRDYIKNCSDMYKFLLRTKVPRSSRLMLEFEDGTSNQLQNVCRYYVSSKGGKLIKVMPPLEGETEDRRMGIETEWSVKACNNIKDFRWDIDYEYYISEAEKLVINTRKEVKT